MLCTGKPGSRYSTGRLTHDIMLGVPLSLVMRSLLLTSLCHLLVYLGTVPKQTVVGDRCLPFNTTVPVLPRSQP